MRQKYFQYVETGRRSARLSEAKFELHHFQLKHTATQFQPLIISNSSIPLPKLKLPSTVSLRRVGGSHHNGRHEVF